MYKVVLPPLITYGAYKVPALTQAAYNEQQLREKWLEETREKQEKLIDDISTQFNNRYHYLYRVYEVIRDGTDEKTISSRWEEYEEVAKNWHLKVLKTRTVISRFTPEGSDLADKYIRAKTSKLPPETETVYTTFSEAEKKVKEVKEQELSSGEKGTNVTDDDLIDAFDGIKKTNDQYLDNLHKALEDYKIEGLRIYLEKITNKAKVSNKNKPKKTKQA